jgi:hypothetical protein
MNTNDYDNGSIELLNKFYTVLYALKNPQMGSTGQVGSRKYKYTDLFSLVNDIKKVLREHGLAFYQPIYSCDGKIGIRTIVFDNNGDSMVIGEMDVDVSLLIEQANKATAKGSVSQEIGVWITYARRYSLLSGLGLVGDDDTDGVNKQGAQPQHKHPKHDEFYARMCAMPYIDGDDTDSKNGVKSNAIKPILKKLDMLRGEELLSAWLFIMENSYHDGDPLDYDYIMGLLRDNNAPMMIEVMKEIIDRK